MLAIDTAPTSRANPGGSTMTQPFGALKVDGVPVQRLVPEYRSTAGEAMVHCPPVGAEQVQAEHPRLSMGVLTLS